MEDPYKVLGVEKTMSDSDIKQAYRKLAKKWHPDLNPADKVAEARFKEISAAYNLLGDPEKRAKFDRGEIDASGVERPEHRYYKEHAGGEGARQYRSNSNYEDLGGIFSDLFAQEQARGGREFMMRGGDVRYHLSISFLEAVTGAKKRVSLPDGSSLDVKVPEGVRDGQTIRLRGKGQAGLGGGSAGDAFIEIAVQEHPNFRREVDDIIIDLPITIDEAVLGGKVDVQTIGKPLRVAIPAGSSSGQSLRLKGKGVNNKIAGRKGDQRCILKIVLPAQVDDELKSFMEKWREAHAYDPRLEMRGV